MEFLLQNMAAHGHGYTNHLLLADYDLILVYLNILYSLDNYKTLSNI